VLTSPSLDSALLCCAREQGYSSGKGSEAASSLRLSSAPSGASSALDSAMFIPLDKVAFCTNSDGSRRRLGSGSYGTVGVLQCSGEAAQHAGHSMQSAACRAQHAEGSMQNAALGCSGSGF
jgi:hypothetical protein